MNPWLKKHRIKIGIVIVTSVLFNIATFFLPPNFRGLSFYSLIFVVDVIMLALFFSVIKWDGWKRSLFLIIYWLPFTLLTAIILCAIIIPFPDWPANLKIGIAGFFSALFLSHFLFYFFILLIKIADCFKNSGKSIKIVVISGLILSAIMFLTCLAAPFFWTVYPQVVRVNVLSKQWPKAFDGYRIVQISDLHCDYFRNEKPFQRMVDSIQKLKPDLILITGDVVTYKASELKRFIPILQQLQASDGIFCIMGNHDYGSYYNRWESMDEVFCNQAELFDYYRKMHWTLLRNASDFIEKSGDTLVISGTENQCLKETYYPCKGDINTTLQGISEKYPIILMTHDPVYWEKVISQEKRPILLTLSGHTHGMQIGQRLESTTWSALGLVKKYWGGLFEENGHYLYVNTGYGTVGFPFRLGLNPEITLLTLERE